MSTARQAMLEQLGAKAMSAVQVGACKNDIVPPPDACRLNQCTPDEFQVDIDGYEGQISEAVHNCIQTIVPDLWGAFQKAVDPSAPSRDLTLDNVVKYNA